jgi:peroxiredoxin Q/BCP
MTSGPQEGERAPDFTVETTEGRLSLSDLLQSGKLVLTFYVEDGTPLCSSQVAAFQQDYPAFEEAGARVLAASADTPESHRAFVEKLGGLSFPLASDADLSLTRAYGVVAEDNKRSRRAVTELLDVAGLGRIRVLVQAKGMSGCRLRGLEGDQP